MNRMVSGAPPVEPVSTREVAESTARAGAGSGQEGERRPAEVEKKEFDRTLLLKRANRLDAAGPTDSIVCELSNGSCLRMSPSAYWLFVQLQRGRSPAQIAAEIADRFGQQVSAEDIDAACSGLLSRITDESRAVAAAMRRRYVFRLRLIPERVVARLATRLTGLLSLPAVVLSACVLTASIILFWVTSLSALGVGQLNLGWSIIAAYLIYLTSLLAHELGHAAACVRYGIPTGDIGFAVYLIFPAIYCDVTRAWLLPRRQRLVVDVAGVWFEVGAGAIFSTVGIIFHAPSFIIAAFMVLGNLLIVLNPLGRFDSYWVLSDAFGIPDLSRQRTLMLRRLFGKRNTPSEPFPISYSGFHKTFILIYAAITVVVVGWFAYTAVRISGPFFSNLNQTFEIIRKDFGHGHTAAGLRNVIGVAPGLLMLGFVAYRLGRMLPLRKILAWCGVVGRTGSSAVTDSQ